MSMSRTLAPHLPYLRRYARALTGSQESGDAYVRAALTALLAGEQALGDDLSPRVALYRLFHRIWSSAGAGLETPGDEPREGPETRLLALSADHRAALLLTAVESFTLDEAGAILDESVRFFAPEIEAREFAKAIESQPLAVIPFDSRLFGEAANNGHMIAEIAANHRTTATFLQIAQRLTGRGETKKPRRSFLSPIIKKLRAGRRRA